MQLADKSEWFVIFHTHDDDTDRYWREVYPVWGFVEPTSLMFPNVNEHMGSDSFSVSYMRILNYMEKEYGEVDTFFTQMIDRSGIIALILGEILEIYALKRVIGHAACGEYRSLETIENALKDNELLLHGMRGVVREACMSHLQAELLRAQAVEVGL